MCGGGGTHVAVSSPALAVQQVYSASQSHSLSPQQYQAEKTDNSGLQEKVKSKFEGKIGHSLSIGDPNTGSCTFRSSLFSGISATVTS